MTEPASSAASQDISSLLRSTAHAVSNYAHDARTVIEMGVRTADARAEAATTRGDAAAAHERVAAYEAANRSGEMADSIVRTEANELEQQLGALRQAAAGLDPSDPQRAVADSVLQAGEAVLDRSQDLAGETRDLYRAERDADRDYHDRGDHRQVGEDLRTVDSAAQRVLNTQAELTDISQRMNAIVEGDRPTDGAVPGVVTPSGESAPAPTEAQTEGQSEGQTEGQTPPQAEAAPPAGEPANADGSAATPPTTTEPQAPTEAQTPPQSEAAPGTGDNAEQGSAATMPSGQASAPTPSDQAGSSSAGDDFAVPAQHESPEQQDHHSGDDFAQHTESHDSAGDSFGDTSHNDGVPLAEPELEVVQSH